MAYDMRTETVTLKHPTVVHDELRNPVEGAISASPSEVARLRAAGALIEDDEHDEDHGNDVPEDLKDLKVAELKALALKDGVPLNDATKRADIIAAFVAFRTKEA